MLAAASFLCVRETFLIIPCGSDKAEAPAPAAELYVGGMFRSALAAAKAEADACGGTVLILSALHGLIALDTIVAPYDCKMGDESSVSVERIAEQAQELGVVWGADVYAFLPRAYFDRLDAALRLDDVYAAQVYEACGGIGEQRGVCRIVRELPAVA